MSDGPVDPRPRIEVGDVVDGVLVVRLLGEHDLASRERVARALDVRGAGVVVDLRGCSFVDSSVVNVFVRAHQRLATAGQSFELLVSEGTVSGALDVMGVGSVIPIRRD